MDLAVADNDARDTAFGDIGHDCGEEEDAGSGCPRDIQPIENQVSLVRDLQIPLPYDRCAFVWLRRGQNRTPGIDRRDYGWRSGTWTAVDRQGDLTPTRVGHAHSHHVV